MNSSHGWIDPCLDTAVDPSSDDFASMVAELAGDGDYVRGLEINTGSNGVLATLAFLTHCCVLKIPARIVAGGQPEPLADRQQEVNVSCASPEQLPFSAGAFDLIVCRAAADQFHGIRPALDEILRVMCSTGVLILGGTVPAQPSPSRWRESGAGIPTRLWQLPPPSPAAWCRLLEEHGLTVDTVVTTRRSSLHAGDRTSLQPGVTLSDPRWRDRVLPHVEWANFIGRAAELGATEWSATVVRAKKS